MEFEWDPKKAAANTRKNNVTFQEAATVFGDHWLLRLMIQIILLTKTGKSHSVYLCKNDCSLCPIRNVEVEQES